MTWLDAHADRLHRRSFLDLPAIKQQDILDRLAYKERFRAGEEEGREFFNLIREYTIMGFYTSKVGLRELDYPGLQVFYTSTPGCPHHGDPEHRHVAAPRR